MRLRYLALMLVILVPSCSVVGGKRAASTAPRQVQRQVAPPAQARAPVRECSAEQGRRDATPRS
jgi:hypothetical protein